MIPFSLSVEGMSDLLNRFERVERGIIDLRQLGTWRAVESEFRKVQKTIFESGGAASAGGTWAQLSPEYATAKSRRFGGPTRLLIASGDMFQEFTTMGGGDVDAQAQSLTIGLGPPAGYHMSKEPRSKMPYRSSLDFTDDQKKQITDPIIKKLKQLIDSAKLRDIRGF